MALTITNYTGDGVNDPVLATTVGLPDSLPDNVTVTGTVDQQGQPTVTVTGSPLAGPAPPPAGSSNTCWIIQVNTTTGAASVKQAGAVFPSPDPGNVQIFAQTLTPTTGGVAADPALVPTDATPDSN